MTRPELHTLVDMVMDARGRGAGMAILMYYNEVNVYDLNNVLAFDKYSGDYPAFSDFTKAVQEYIKTLETKQYGTKQY